jgi:pimeloyl-ACP methyl ester carboxylesterase
VAAQHELILVDLPGHGRSPPPVRPDPSGYATTTPPADAAALVTAYAGVSDMRGHIPARTGPRFEGGRRCRFRSRSRGGSATG